MSARVASQLARSDGRRHTRGQAVARKSTCIWLCCWCTSASSFLFFVAASVSRPLSTSTSAAEPSGAAPCLDRRAGLCKQSHKRAGATAACAADHS